MPEQYYSLTWYDFNLLILQYEEMQEARKFEYESSWDQTRNMMALIANIVRDPKKTPAFKPSDFKRLSWDGDVERVEVEIPTPERIEYLKRRFGATIKKKNGK